MKPLQYGDDWYLKDPEVITGYNRPPQMAGVFTVNGKRYFCSLILLPEATCEFMAFKWNEHADKVTNWMDVFAQRFPLNPNAFDPGAGADIDVTTFHRCMKAFYEFLTEKEEKENDD